MKNYQIPPLATLITALILIFLMRLPFWNSEAVIVKAIQGLAGVLFFIGIAGLIRKLFVKKDVRKT